MFERPNTGERAILVQLALPDVDAYKALMEFQELAKSANAEVVGIITGSREVPEAKYYIGHGKAEELHEAVSHFEAEVVLINHELSPSQERNLEKLIQCRVISRSGLILDIFAKRARTFEGKLQVELAQLDHLSTRLIRGWTHLERQKGGIGLRGPGETQLETDRRLLRKRIQYIKKRLEKVRANREQNRTVRHKRDTKTVSLVGYTNAGKSTLFNILTGANIYVADKLFATLDPSMRQLSLPGDAPVALIDTVGFIRDLPHSLIDAFRATLEETKEADLLLHVIDISEADWRDTVATVDSVLEEIGASDIPIIQVFNKIDEVKDLRPNLIQQEVGYKVWVSAKTGLGLDLLRSAITGSLRGEMIEEEIELSEQEAKLRANLYQIGAVLEDLPKESGGWHLKLRLSKNEKNKLLKDR